MEDVEVVPAGNVKAMANEHNFVFCATKWIGMADEDLSNAEAILQDLRKFRSLADDRRLDPSAGDRARAQSRCDALFQHPGHPYGSVRRLRSDRLGQRRGSRADHEHGPVGRARSALGPAELACCTARIRRAMV